MLMVLFGFLVIVGIIIAAIASAFTPEDKQTDIYYPPIKGRKPRARGGSLSTGIKKAYKANLREPFAPPRRKRSGK